MIRVADAEAEVVALRGRADQPVGPDLSDDPGQVLAQAEGRFHPAVRITEEAQVVHAYLLGCRGLLGVPQRRHVGAGDARVASASVAIGDDAVGDVDAGVGPARDRAGRAEVHVVRMGGDDQDAADLSVFEHVPDPTGNRERGPEPGAFLSRHHPGRARARDSSPWPGTARGSPPRPGAVRDSSPWPGAVRDSSPWPGAARDSSPRLGAGSATVSAGCGNSARSVVPATPLGRSGGRVSSWPYPDASASLSRFRRARPAARQASGMAGITYRKVYSCSAAGRMMIIAAEIQIRAPAAVRLRGMKRPASPVSTMRPSSGPGRWIRSWYRTSMVAYGCCRRVPVRLDT